MRLSTAVFSIIGTFATLSACEGVINSNGSQAVAVLDRNGVPMPVLEATLNLDYFDDDLNVTEGDFLSGVRVLPLAGSTLNASNFTAVEPGV